MSELARIGKFFLKRKGARGTIHICWYDPATRQTVGTSTRTTDLAEAEAKLAEHVLRHERPQGLLDAPLADCLNRYYLEHASKKPSADVAKQAIRNAVEIWGNPMVSELLPAKQMEFIRALREGYDGQEPLSDHTILSRLSRIWAAMNYCKAEGIIQFVPTMVRRERWEPHLPSGGRELSIAELGRLFHEAGRRDTPTSREHLWRFMVLAVGTAHRRSALQELRKDQVDLENGIIQLNPEGRRQTKKRRPTLPMSQILRAHIKEWDASPSGHYVTYNGRPLTSDTWFDNLREAAKVDCSANDIRHTVITWMVKQKVDPVQRRIFEGHKAPSESGAEDSYIHLDPNYLIEPRRAVDKLFKAIAPHVKSRQLVKRQAS